MEKDDEVKGNGNHYTTFYRLLDPRIGRWFSVDPVIQPWQSPYTSMDNNPIWIIDPEGNQGGKGNKRNKGNSNSETYIKLTIEVDKGANQKGLIGLKWGFEFARDVEVRKIEFVLSSKPNEEGNYGHIDIVKAEGKTRLIMSKVAGGALLSGQYKVEEEQELINGEWVTVNIEEEKEGGIGPFVGRHIESVDSEGNVERIEEVGFAPSAVIRWGGEAMGSLEVSFEIIGATEVKAQKIDPAWAEHQRLTRSRWMKGETLQKYKKENSQFYKEDGTAKTYSEFMKEKDSQASNG